MVTGPWPVEGCPDRDKSLSFVCFRKSSVHQFGSSKHSKLCEYVILENKQFSWHFPFVKKTNILHLHFENHTQNVAHICIFVLLVTAQFGLRRC